MDSRNKTIKFYNHKKEDVKLWKYLSSLPHGKFSEETKKFWLDKMKEEKE